VIPRVLVDGEKDDEEGGGPVGFGGSAKLSFGYKLLGPGARREAREGAGLEGNERFGRSTLSWVMDMEGLDEW